MSELNFTNMVAGRATVPQILADLLVLGHDLRLPDPIDMNAMSNGIVTIGLSSREGLDAWNAALGGDTPTSQLLQAPRLAAGKWLHNSWIRGRLGWNIGLSAQTDSAPGRRDLYSVLAVIADPAVAGDLAAGVDADDRVELTESGRAAAQVIP